MTGGSWNVCVTYANGDCASRTPDPCERASDAVAQVLADPGFLRRERDLGLLRIDVAAISDGGRSR